MMKEPEEAIERVLTGLRNADAPVGMERRILEALEGGASVRSRWSWYRWPIAPVNPVATRWMKWGVAFATVSAVVLVITMNRWSQQAPTPPQRVSASVAPLPAVASGGDTNSLEVTPSRSSVRLMKAANTGKRASERGPVVVDDSESLALEEMRAASHPPPPMPLTDQEKLLLRIARKGDPGEVAALNPAVREARYEAEKTEVERFFKTERSGDSE
jgi:hypothetical protein